MDGYMGRILRVDLNTGTLTDVPLDPSLARAYIGGSGLGARLVFDMVDADTDPLGPDNPLVLMAGPLVGTSMPSAGRCSVCALSPLTGIWGEANTGGFLGPEMRFAGYDGIVITGQASQPVWLSVVHGEPRLHADARQLWGLDTYATQDQVRELLGEPRARVACIGAAGENPAKMAAVMNDHGRAAGRTGMGTVMGSKRLKAIAFRGDERVPLADPEAYRTISREITAGLDADMLVATLRTAGTAAYVDSAIMFGDLPTRYYQQGEWLEADELSGILMTDRYLKRQRACYRCPIACGLETHAPRYGAERVDGPEFETIGALGTLPMVSDMEAVIYAGHLCNLYGLDTISTGSTIALACEMFERGILTTADTGGLEIRYGDASAIHRAIPMIARRVGFGDVLAEGSAHLATLYGVPELAVTVNRLEVPLHDPRAFVGMAPAYATSPRGACHMQGDPYSVDTGQNPPTEIGIVPGDRLASTVEKGRITARLQAWRSVYNALTLCQFMNPGVDPLVRALRAATGWQTDADDLLRTGERIFTLKRLLNRRRGLTRADDRLPGLLQQPFDTGGTGGTVPDLATMLVGTYAEHGWDAEDGMPTAETLRTLGLEDLLRS